MNFTYVARTNIDLGLFHKLSTDIVGIMWLKRRINKTSVNNSNLLYGSSILYVLFRKGREIIIHLRVARVVAGDPQRVLPCTSPK